jgi:hypothetical protein
LQSGFIQVYNTKDRDVANLCAFIEPCRKIYVLDLGISSVFADESVDSVDGVKSKLWQELLGTGDASGGDSEQSELMIILVIIRIN